MIFKQYFCTLSLKEGTIALGILSIVTSVIYFFACVYLMAIETRLDEYFVHQIDEDLGNEVTVQTAQRAIKIFIELLVIECLFTLFSAVAMIVAAKTVSLLEFLFKTFKNINRNCISRITAFIYCHGCLETWFKH